jgi:hypothetical protein
MMPLGIRIECHYAKCCAFLIVKMSVVMLNAVMLSVVAPIKNLGCHCQLRLHSYFKRDYTDNWNFHNFVNSWIGNENIFCNNMINFICTIKKMSRLWTNKIKPFLHNLHIGQINYIFLMSNLLML